MRKKHSFLPKSDLIEPLIIMKNSLSNPVKPFLRWAGGKTWLVKEIDQFLPGSFNNYFEPFLGGGSIFIYLKSAGLIKKKAFLSDKNEELINAYIVVQNYPDELIELLNSYKNESNFYYSLRDQTYSDIIQRAARFVYLNRTSFNGIYRVNLNGKYNVPFGNKKYSQLFDLENIYKLSSLFSNVSFTECDFEETLEVIEEEDLVFLDPPYTVAHENNGFIKYNQKIFAWNDQQRLKSFIDKLNTKGAYYILTNAAHENIENLFHNIGNKSELQRYIVIGGKGAERKIISEYVFTNFR